MKKVEVTVVFKAHATFSKGGGTALSIHTQFLITFESASKERFVFSFGELDYMSILEGDKGILTLEEGKSLFGKSTGNFVFKSFDRITE